MEHFKQEVKDWLKSSGKDRQWLSEQLNTPKRTIDNWLSPSYKGFPSKWYIKVKELMDQDRRNNLPQTNRQSPNTELMILKFTEREWSLIKKYKENHPDNSLEAMAEQSIIDWVNSHTETKRAGIKLPPLPRKEGGSHECFRGIIPTSIQRITGY